MHPLLIWSHNVCVYLVANTLAILMQLRIWKKCWNINSIFLTFFLTIAFFKYGLFFHILTLLKTCLSPNHEALDKLFSVVFLLIVILTSHSHETLSIFPLLSSYFLLICYLFFFFLWRFFFIFLFLI